jgi:thiaminase
MLSEVMKNQSKCNYGRPCKKRQRQRAQIERNPACAGYTPHMHSPATAGDVLRGRHA